ncbi:ferredoxin--NADP reductase [Rhodothermus bifroesti]|uniref:ferredoxin--NADP(+) reductase n=1 Tax=Rhodothermus marinus TaxID=29549 RepID=A0A7V2B0N7_RHOMR|nr:ferredoxin--NADP reductase [Rhodothermus bifroesti]GBD00598.1 Ferredoxin--NADP reductase [bacterium HR18]
MSTAKFCRVRLVERIDFTEDLALFRFRPEEPVVFTPGQYATLALEVKGKLVPRAYSIVSAPHEPELEFFIELVPHGELTPRIWELREGDEMWMRRKIVGHFTLQTQRTRHLMLATVTGIAPYLSMIRAQRHAIEQGETSPHRFLVIHGASRSKELGVYLDELRTLAQQNDWLTYVPTISRPWEDPDWQGETGRVDDVIRKYLDAAADFGPETAVAYACGHPQMIENARGILRRARFADAFIREEQYFVQKSSEKPTPQAPSSTAMPADRLPPNARPMPAVGKLPPRTGSSS